MSVAHSDSKVIFEGNSLYFPSGYCIKKSNFLALNSRNVEFGNRDRYIFINICMCSYIEAI